MCNYCCKNCCSCIIDDERTPSRSKMKELKFKEGDGLIHHNNIAYIFKIVAVSQQHNFYVIIPQGNNYVETLNSNLMLVSADVIEKEFYPIESPIEIEL